MQKAFFDQIDKDLNVILVGDNMDFLLNELSLCGQFKDTDSFFKITGLYG